MAPEPTSAPTYADWLERVREELGVEDPLAALSSRSVGGPVVRPLYTADDLPADASLRPERRPGRPRIAVRPRGASPVELNAAAREELAGGASALRLPREGYRDVATLDAVLAGVTVEAVALELEAGADALPAAAIVRSFLDRRGLRPADVTVAVGADPLGALAVTGRLPRSVERHLAETGVLALACDAELPGWRAIEVRGASYHEAGADDVQELGVVLAASVTYLRALEAAGLPPERGVPQIGWSLSQGRDLFLQVAKLRAARRLWERLQVALGVTDPRPLALHAGGSRRALTRYDRWANILRGTTQAAAALLGGADSLTVEPFDAALGAPGELGRRLARNTVHVLEAESALAAIADPAGGSYTVERLTDELARGAWDVMRAVERDGGLAAALASGALQERVAARSAERREAVARRREPITGVSEYASLDEEPPPASAPPESRPAARTGPRSRPAEERDAPHRPPLDRRWLAAATATAGEGADLEELSAWLTDGGTGERVEPLPRLRDAEPFERLRDAAAAAPERPALFLANLGPPRCHAARAAFAERALAAGGVATVRSEGTGTGDAEEAAAALADAFRDSGLAAACLCGDDELYAALGTAAVATLEGAGASPLWVVAPPGEPADALLAAGADGLLHDGCDLVERLRTLHEALGLASAEGGD